MNKNTCNTMNTARKGTTANALRSAFAALLVGTAFYAHDSNAVLVLANGVHEIEWRVGEPTPSIDLAPDSFVVLACGPELTWVYATFPTIATRTIEMAAMQKKKSAHIAGVPMENTCVLWRGDNARFIADNLSIYGG